MAGKKTNNNNAVTKASQKQQQQSADFNTLTVVTFYIFLIVFLPVSSFFLMKSFLLDYLFTLDEVSKCVYSAVAAVAGLHLALGLYLWRAFFSTDTTTSKKSD